MQISPDRGDTARVTVLQRVFMYFFRSFFKLLYHQFAWTYDFVASVVSDGNWGKWTQSVVPYLAGPVVLEIGFGPGHLLLSLQQKNITAIGLDESPQMAHLARKRLISHSCQASLVRGDALKLPFARDCINQVVMTFPAEYVLKPNTLLEIRRVLVSGGSALVLPFAWITGRKPMERLLAWVNRITGEAPAWKPAFVDPLRGYGFDVSWQEISFPNSKIVLIQLIKELSL
jgi:ubiquinone/menaquinone biosynthesis C-methylase UbiE